MKFIFLQILTFVLLLLNNCATLRVKPWNPPYQAGNLDQIRVLLGETNDVAAFRSKGIIYAYDVNNLLIKKSFDFLQVNTKSLKAEISLASEDGLLQFNNKTFRGKIKLKPNDNGKTLIINFVNLEDYLKGVVPAEMPSSWPLEALKAQAICARTYAMKKIIDNKNNEYDVDTSTKTQVYGGVEKEHPNSNQAIEITKGMLVTYKDNIIQTFFHSNSGGETESPDNVWGGDKNQFPYLISKKSNFCSKADNYYWTDIIGSEQLNQKLFSLNIGEILDIGVLSRTSSGRVDLMEIVGSNGILKLSGVDFRKAVGENVIKSLRFGIKKDRKGYLVKGLGSGHGVGLSQWGSYEMAKEQYNFETILRYYYKGVTLSKVMTY